MDQPKLTSKQENQPPAADLSDKLRAMDLGAEQHENLAQVTEDKTAEAPKPKHRRTAGLRLKANAQPAPKDGLRRFALRVANRDEDSTFEAPGFVSKELPKLFASDRIHEWRGFQLGKWFSSPDISGSTSGILLFTQPLTRAILFVRSHVFISLKKVDN